MDQPIQNVLAQSGPIRAALKDRWQVLHLLALEDHKKLGDVWLQVEPGMFSYIGPCPVPIDFLPASEQECRFYLFQWLEEQARLRQGA